jgi:protein involved in polysaccharide export with SLBB domain
MNKRRIIFFSILVSILTQVIAQDLSKLSPQQISELKKLSGSYTKENLSGIDNVTKERKYENDSIWSDDEKELRKFDKTDKKNRVFGTEIFNNSKLNFEPNINIATPQNYLLGTYDELLVDIAGLYDVNYKLKVNPEGKIRIPNVGLINVGGLTVETATRNIKNELSRIYTGIGSGETRVSVSLGNIRSIRVSIIGEAKYPGTYTLPSLATVFNAIYACGGPGEIGSMRDIKVFRGGKILAKIDFYDFLVSGNYKNNINLQDNDVIKIEPNNMRIKVGGSVNREGIYETVAGESLKEMIQFAGGFAENANKSMVTIIRFADNGKTVLDIPGQLISTCLMKAGDSIYVSQMVDKFDNLIVLEGAVRRPGSYAVESSGMTISKLIDKAGGLLDEAFINMALLTRQRKNQTPEIISFNLGKVLKNETEDIALMPNDSIKINFVSDMTEDFKVEIAGEVLEPGEFPLSKDMSVRDLIFMAKGFTENAATDQIQLIRIIKDPLKMEKGNRKSVSYNFKLDKNLNIESGSAEVKLENGDLVIVRSIEGIEPIRIVQVQGEVKNPGYYNIENKNIKVSDLIEMSGGFTKFAFVGGAYLIRNEKNNAQQNSMNKILSRNLRKILFNASSNNLDEAMINKMKANNIDDINAVDTISKFSNFAEIREMLNSEGIVSLNLDEIIRNPGIYKDINIEDGDILYIPRSSQTVKVLGEVMYQSYVVYNNNLGLKDYITASGGFSNKALRKNTFIMYPNGQVVGTKSFLGINVYPRVLSGSIIIVPKKNIDISGKLNVAEIVTMTSSLTSTLALVYSIIKPAN